MAKKASQTARKNRRYDREFEEQVVQMFLDGHSAESIEQNRGQKLPVLSISDLSPFPFPPVFVLSWRDTRQSCLRNNAKEQRAWRGV